MSVDTLMIRFLTLLIALSATLSAGQMPPDETYGNDKIVILVRHAEKCKSDDRDPALTDYGIQRAHDLARAIEHFEIDRIYSTPFKRTTRTAEPSSAAFGVEIQITPLSRNLVDETAEAVLADDGKSILVVGHSNTTARVVNRLAGTNLQDITDEDYDDMFVVSLSDTNGASLMRFRYGSASGPVEECD